MRVAVPAPPRTMAFPRSFLVLTDTSGEHRPATARSYAALRYSGRTDAGARQCLLVEL